jgi:hypothetical protein
MHSGLWGTRNSGGSGYWYHQAQPL